MILKCENLCFSYGTDREILSGLNFETCSGRLMAIAGANGGGKSTLISILSGFLKPQHGTYYFIDEQGEQIIDAQDKNALLPQNIDHWLLGETGREDIGLGLDLKSSATRQLIDELTQRWKIETLLDLPVENLSLGQKKRIALVAALARKPSAIFLDEPLNGLDWPGTKVLMEDLAQLKACGIICIIVSHDPEPLSSLIDDWLLLSPGRYLFARGTSAYEHFEDFGVRPLFK